MTVLIAGVTVLPGGEEDRYDSTVAAGETVSGWNFWTEYLYQGNLAVEGGGGVADTDSWAIVAVG